MQMQVLLGVLISLSIVYPGAANAQTRNRRLQQNRQEPSPDMVSPARRIRRDQRRSDDSAGDAAYRSIDGRNNSQSEPEMGAAGTPLLRLAPVGYTDGAESLAGNDRPGPREISNAVLAQDGGIPDSSGASDLLWLWGQFLDHDIDLTDGVDPPELAPIAVPLGDPYFDPFATGEEEIAFNRSLYDPTTGLSANNPRQQINEITAWIDASNVYGSDADRAAALRTNDGSGELRTSAGNLLPYNEDELANAGGSSPDLFLAGDVRANENAALTAMHTLFVREHNRLARRIRRSNRRLDGDEIYERARRIVIAELQAITYEEFLPVLLGDTAPGRYDGYQPDLQVGIFNEFSTAAYRFGHSALSPTLLRLDANGDELESGPLALRDAFFAPEILADEGIEPLLRGLASQACQKIDARVIDDVRNFLFGPPGAGGFDLASLNIQRGRDHGLPSYNELRIAMGLPPAADFEDITTDPETVNRLRQTYASVDQIDPWVGGLAEDPVAGAMVGELVATILREQFELLRDGDRFWYEREFEGRTLRRLRATRLAQIIRRNTSIRDEIQDDVFIAP